MDLEFPQLQITSAQEPSTMLLHTSLILHQCAELCPTNTAPEDVTPLDDEPSLMRGTKRPPSPLDYIAETALTVSRKRARTAVSKQKRVHFDLDSEGKSKAPKNDIPRVVYQEDLPNVWYSRQEYRSFQEDSNSLALAFELGILDRIPEEEYCLRGLEANISKQHLESRLASRAALIEFILRTQEAQKGHGVDADPELIRGLSLVLSKDACEDALKLAAYDREEADHEFQQQQEQQGDDEEEESSSSEHQ